MAPDEFQITVETTAIALDGTQYPGWMGYTEGPIWIGGSGVTTSTGIPIEEGFFSLGDAYHRRLTGRSQSERLYAISGGSVDVRVVALA